jgi:hypothetical protein
MKVQLSAGNDWRAGSDAFTINIFIYGRFRENHPLTVQCDRSVKTNSHNSSNSLSGLA